MLNENTKRAAEILGKLADNKTVASLIEKLKSELRSSPEQFVWKTINEHLAEQELESEFKSAWMFILRKNTPSEAHYHPNSTQYTAVIDGEGNFDLDGVKISLQKFNPMLPETLFVINKGKPHEFFPGNKDLVVLSLHTVTEDELIEINCSQGKERKYE